MTDCIQYFVDFGFIDKIDTDINKLENNNSKQIISNDNFLILKENKVKVFIFNLEQITIIKEQLIEKVNEEDLNIIPIIDLTKIKERIKTPPTTIEEFDKLFEDNKKYFYLFLDIIPSFFKNIIIKYISKNIDKDYNEINYEEIFNFVKYILNTLIKKYIKDIKQYIQNIQNIQNKLKIILANIEFNQFLIFNYMILSFNKFKNNIKLILIYSFLNESVLSYKDINYINNYYKLNKKEILINEKTYKKYKDIVKSFIHNQNKNYYQLDDNINLENISDIFNDIKDFNKLKFYKLINNFIQDNLIEKYTINLNIKEIDEKYLELYNNFKLDLKFMKNNKDENKPEELNNINIENFDLYIKIMEELDKFYNIYKYNYNYINENDYITIENELKKNNVNDNNIIMYIYMYIRWNNIKKDFTKAINKLYYNDDIIKYKEFDNFSEINNILLNLNEEINNKYNINNYINNYQKNNNINYYLQYLFDVAKIESNVNMCMYALNITNIGIVPNFKEYLNNNKCKDLEYLYSKIKEN